jgi:hypothetical protein
MSYENKGILRQSLTSAHRLNWRAAGRDISGVDTGEKCFGFNWKTGEI